MIKKELAAAKYDLKRAQYSVRDNDHKWATIQGYYAFFHSARALVYAAGYREKSHRCLLVAIQVLYIDKGRLPPEYADRFREAMDLREDADYGYIYSASSSRSIIDSAQVFFDFTRRYLKST